MFFDVDQIIQTGGLLAIMLIIFAETGLLIGFFLPGDTLLIAAGIFAAQGKLPLIPLIFLTFLAAFLGYQAGYLIGKRAGPRLFKREDGVLFRAEYITRSEDFFTKHGGKSILLARFVPIVRTVVPLVAGIGKMSRKRFVFYNICGGILWVGSVILASYWLGNKLPNLDQYLIYLLILAMILTTSGTVIESLRTPARRQAVKKAFKDELKYFLPKKNKSDK